MSDSQRTAPTAESVARHLIELLLDPEGSELAFTIRVARESQPASQDEPTPAKQKEREGREPLLTVAKVAEFVQLRPETIRHAIHEGSLRASTYGRQYRIAPSDCDEWIESHQFLAAVGTPDLKLPKRRNGETEFGRVAREMRRGNWRQQPRAGLAAGLAG